jgi:nucleotide-binding universal stress UspA family protein
MTVLVALDGSDAGFELLTSAKNLATALGRPVRAVHVRAADGGAHRPIPADLGPHVELIEVDGDPATEILRSAGAADVTIVAFSLRGDEGDGHGHVADALLRSSPHLLFVMRPGMRAVVGLRRILIPLEGSPSSSEAMRQADDAFCRPGREIVLLHVVTSDTPLEAGSMPAPRIMDQEHYEWAEWQEEFRMRFAQCPKGGRHRVAVRVGEPGPVIVKEAGELGAELIVVSWSQSLDEGRAAHVRSLIGAAPCPLLLVPPPA